MENKEMVTHPDHYNWIPGIECMDVVRHFDFVLGNAIKYLWRAGYKYPDTKLQDLRKAKYYIDLEIDILVEEMAGEKKNDQR